MRGVTSDSVVDVGKAVPMTRQLSASRLNKFLGCAHQAALWLAGVAQDEHVDATLELIRSKGFEHEARVLARLEETYGAAVRIPDNVPFEERQAVTIAAVKEGASLIYQGALAADQWIGFPDFIVRNGETEGINLYEPEDAKLARAAKPEYVLQLGIYAWLFERLLGQAISGGAIHVGVGDAAKFDLRQTHYILRRFMRTFERFVADEKRATTAVPCSACAQCDYKQRCEDEWRAADSPYFVAGVSGAQVLKLAAAGITTLEALAAAPVGTTIGGIGLETVRKLIAQARLQFQARHTGKHEIEILPPESGRGFHLLPPPDADDLYFDMEGDPLYEDGLEYLFGIWGPLGADGAEAFHPVWAHDRVAEKAAFEEVVRLFVAHVERHPNAHIYHYAQYEPNALKRLAMRHAAMEAEVDQLLRERRFVDLYRVARQGIRASTEGYSLKDLEKIYWGARAGAVTTAADSIVEYERWCVSRDQAILDSIASYNKDDCVSTQLMHRWLEQQRPVGVAYQVPGALDGSEDDRAAERSDREAKKQELAARVRASGQSDERVRDLVAELLWFHQRSQKPGWWALFERQAWSDDELIDDAESLGAITLDASVSPVPFKRSFDTTYSFPPQDTKLKIAARPKVAETLANAGTIVDLSAEDGRLVLRRGAKAPPLPEQFALLPAPISLQGIPDAVAAFATSFAAGETDAYRALIDILERRPPRLKGRDAGASILNAGEDIVAGAVRAALDLNCSCLVIQGPPGTGKTFTTAAAILVLLEAGYRVGVSSNSHKAINKVLEEVEKQAADAGRSFRGAKKGNEDDPETEFNSDHITTVYSSEDVTEAHRLVGGTVFHFSREDQLRAFDYLIVDEAGQVALGNLVAMAGAARNILLVGDQMQLAQPVQGVHPGQTGLSCLEYLLEGKATVPPDGGILLNETRRLHPDLCDFISAAIYDGLLKAHPSTSERRLVLDEGANPHLKPAGIVQVDVAHEGNTQSSIEEAQAIAGLVDNLLEQRVHRRDGTVERMTLHDILIVAPYNMQVNLLKDKLPNGARVGTVDKFQGQEAPVVIVSMTTSRGEDAPRGTAFLFNKNRFNVAVSRAECLAIVVRSPALLEGSWSRTDDLERLNLFAHAEAVSAAGAA